MSTYVLDPEFRKRVKALVRWPNNNDCWQWEGPLHSRGYGLIPGNRKMFGHRVMWEIENGPVPDGYYLLQTCNNRSCVNPSHWQLGTRAEARARRSSRSRQRADLTAWDEGVGLFSVKPGETRVPKVITKEVSPHEVDEPDPLPGIVQNLAEHVRRTNDETIRLMNGIERRLTDHEQRGRDQLDELSRVQAKMLEQLSALSTQVEALSAAVEAAERAARQSPAAPPAVEAPAAPVAEGEPMRSAPAAEDAGAPQTPSGPLVAIFEQALETRVGPGDADVLLALYDQAIYEAGPDEGTERFRFWLERFREQALQQAGGDRSVAAFVQMVRSGSWASPPTAGATDAAQTTSSETAAPGSGS